VQDTIRGHGFNLKASTGRRWLTLSYRTEAEARVIRRQARPVDSQAARRPRFEPPKSKPNDHTDHGDSGSNPCGLFIPVRLGKTARRPARSDRVGNCRFVPRPTR
jgi:hypothetical protein